MAENINNYPSCIKIPNSNQNHKKVHQTKENVPLVMQQKKIIHANKTLLSLADKIFGEAEWSHSVTNQTLDFVDSVMNSYVVGCCTFVKIQLCSGIFHEDMGYSTKEGSVKGEVIHCARLASYNDALIKTLCSFGGKIKIEVEKCTENIVECPTLPIRNISSPISHDKKEKKELSPTNTNISFNSILQILESNTDNVLSNNVTSTKDQIVSKSNICIDQGENNDKKISKEEMLRLERKRKQMEKQMEYKKLMKEKELKKNNNEQK